MQRKMWIMMVACLLAAAGAWFFWPHARHVVVKKFAAPTTAMVHPASTASAAMLPPGTNTTVATVKTNPFAFRLSNTTKTIGQLTSDRHAILLENALIDTTANLSLKIPAHLRSAGDPGAYIVQAQGPISTAFRMLLARSGAQIVSYIPNDAYLVRLTAGRANALAADPLVQTVLPYEPYYKVESALLGLAVNQQPLPAGQVLTLGLFAAGAEATEAQIEKLGAKIVGQDRSPFGPIVRVQPPADWLGLVQLPGVQVVEPASRRVAANDLSRQTEGVAADSVTPTNYLGLTGLNVMVEVNDSGIDATHPDFSANGASPVRVLGDSIYSLVDTNGHGTHVAGIIAGDGTESMTVTNAQGSIMPGTNGQFRGMAPMATLYSVAMPFLGGSNTNYVSDSYLQETPAKTNALISNNSWVYDGNNVYDLAAASYDAAVRDAIPEQTGPQPVLFVFAAGNGGSGDTGGGNGNPDSISSPGTSKNVITVGALEQFRNITNTYTPLYTSNQVAAWQAETDSKYQVAWYSARGNVGIGEEGAYGRFKPDVVAPGSFVISTRSAQWDTNAYYNPTNYYDNAVSDFAVTNGPTFYNFPFVVKSNAVNVSMQLYPNISSPTPFPTNVPIYVSLNNYPNPANPSTYDFFTAKDNVTIPPDGPANYLNSIINNFGGFNFAVVDNTTNNPLNYDLLAQMITTNDLGNYYSVLQQLNDNLDTPSPLYYYRYESGTSMAAANVSGVLADMQDFFVNQRNPNSPTNPSPALLKALLINGARPTGFYNFQVDNPINYQGWGLVSLPNSIPLSLTNTAISATNTIFFVDQTPTNTLATGDSRTYTISLSPGAAAQALHITLAWTDPPGNPAAAIKLVNNLDLIVTNTDNPTNPVVYVGNDIAANQIYNSPENVTNVTLLADTVNNVENVFIAPNSGTNFTVVVYGTDVNVNSITTQTNNLLGTFAPNITQDFALVISSGDSANPSGFTITATAALTSPTGDQRITIDTSTNGSPLMNQFVGAASPLLGTNTVGFGTVSSYSPGAVVTVGMTNQWHFYIVTNYGPAADFTNAAFVTLLPPTAALPREGVFANSDVNSTRPEADIDLYVSTDSSLTNLNPLVISNCVNGAQVGVSVGGVFFGSALDRGGSEFVVDTNSTPGQIYYVGVKSEDQTASEYDFLAEFSNIPFSTLNPNGDESVNFNQVSIPDGSANHPASTNTVGLAIYPITVKRVVLTNTLVQQNVGDLVVSLNHPTVASGSSTVVLLNHDSPNTAGTFTYAYDDSGQGDIIPSQRADGPGSLTGFSRQSGTGIWTLHSADSAPGFSGSIRGQMLLARHQDLTAIFTTSIPPGAWFYDYIVVPVGYTNLTIFAVDETPRPPNYLTLALKFGSNPTLTSADESALLNIPDLLPPGLSNSISIGPPLTPGTYYVGVFNPDTIAHTVEIGAFLRGPAASAISTVDYASTDTPKSILDDAVTTDDIFVTNMDIIQGFNVGLRVDHQRISDLAFTLTSPDGSRYLLMENRGAYTTNGCGSTVVITNTVNVSSSGGRNATTNFIPTGETSGQITISYNMYTVPDEMTVYYSTNPTPANLITNIFASFTGQLTVSFPPPGVPATSPYLTIVMNATNHPPSTLWTYTVGGVETNYYYLKFTEDTNLTTTPIKFAPPPFVVVLPTNNVASNNVQTISGFDTVAAGDYTNAVDGWTVVSNQVSVVNDPTNSLDGSQFLALANGSISRTLPTIAGQTYTLTYAYRGPAIEGLWRGEGNANDDIYGNNGTLTTGVTYTNGEVGQAFALPGVSDPQGIHFSNGSGPEVRVPANNLWDFGSNEFTVELWANFNAVPPSFGNPYGYPYGGIFISDDQGSGGNQKWWFALDDGKLDFHINGPTINGGSGVFLVQQPFTPVINTWYHFAVTRMGNLYTIYANGVAVGTATDTHVIPSPDVPLEIGGGDSFYFNGTIDEPSIYGRALSASEVKAIFNAGSAGKYDLGGEFPDNLAEAQIGLAGVTTNIFTGSNTNWQTNAITFTATQNGTPLQIDGLEPGMLMDSFTLSGTTAVTPITGLYYQPEQSLAPIIGTSAFGDWQLEIWDSRTGAGLSNSLTSWQLEFTFANTNFTIPINTNIFTGPVTNTLPGGAIAWYQIDVPTNADYATNTLLFATLPANLWFSTNTPPTITNTPADVILLPGSTGGSAVLGTNGSPANTTTAYITPGGTYYLGVQNPNATVITYAVDVTFHLLPGLPLVITKPATNITDVTATLNALVNPDGLVTTVYFQYGTDTNYLVGPSASIVLSNNLSLYQRVPIGVTNLLPGTVYHFRAVGTNAAGTNYGADLTFRTLFDTPPPYATTMPATLLAGPGAQLNGMATANGQPATAWFEWGTSTAYGNLTPPIAIGTNFNVVYVTNQISLLNTNQVYHYHLVVSNIVGVTYGYDQIFDQAYVVAFGADFFGQTIPVPAGLTNLVVGVGAGYDFSLALNNNGTVVAWGDNTVGQTNVPAGLNNAVAVSGGEKDGLALKSDRTVVVWGSSQFKQTGTNIPTNLTNAVAAVSGGYHCLALGSDGKLVAWGLNNSGQATVPPGLSNVVAVAAGDLHSLALKNDGTVAAWGFNGDGETIVPTGLTNVVAIAAGYYHSLALKSDGTVVAWGDDSAGQADVPPGLTNVVAIAGGGFHSLALKSDGTVTFWGDSSAGQLSNYPDNLTNVVAIAGGGFHSLVLSTRTGYNQTNNPPFWTNNIGTITMNEQTTLVVTNRAIDTNSPPQTITYAVYLSVNTAAMIASNWPTTYAGTNPAPTISSGGVITWTPSETQGPGVYTMTTVATDNGHPPASGTNIITVIVNEVNTAPYWLAFIPNVTNNALTTLVVTNFAGDLDIPPNPLTYSLTVSPAAPNASISTNGIITWTPTLAQAGAVYTFTSVVTDTNIYAVTNRSLSNTNTFTVTVPSVLTNTIVISSIIYTNNGYLLTWFAPSNDLFQVQWTPSLAPTSWTTFTNPPSVSFNPSIVPVNPTNAQFNFFDDGSQTGGLGTNRFYRLILLQVANTLTFPAPSNQIVSLGGTVTVTNKATDSNLGAILTYSLVSAPMGASINTNGIITWTNATPSGLAARFTTLVSDNGTPPAQATNTFTVFVSPFPSITNGFVTATNITLSWSAPTNDQFQVQWTTNLAAPVIWTPFPNVITSASANFSFTDTNAPFLTKFYQLILLP